MNQKRLRRALLANAGFSTLSAVALIVAAGPLATLFGLSQPWILRGVGIGLLLFAIDIVATCRGPEISRSKALYFSAGDFVWVLGSVVLLLFAPLSSQAAAIVVAVGLVVLAFAVAQVRSIRSAHPA